MRRNGAGGAAGALVYLTGATLRNRIAGALRRLRSPRYAAAIVLGVLYLWFALLRPSHGAGEIADALLGERTELLVTVGVLLYVIFGWFGSGERRALAFTEAEVHFLFPAPLPRRALVGYKIFRSQLLIAFNALIWVFVLRRGGGEGLPALLRYLAVWIVLSNVALQRLGGALVRVSWQEHGRAGARAQALPLVILGGILAALAYVLVHAAPALATARAAGPVAVINALTSAFTTTAATVALYPFHIAVAPVFTHDAAGWARAMGPALALALVQVWWVLRTEAAFEEAALEASLERARRIEASRSRGGARGSRVKAGRRAPALAPTGRPAVAIVWKNLVCLLRTGQLSSLVSLLVMAAAVTAVVSSTGPSVDAAAVAVFALIMIALLFVLGTRIVRIDLRQDMLHVEALKALPLTGRALVAAEIASSTLPIAALQIVLVVVAYAALWLVPDAPGSPALRAWLLVAAPVVLLALDAATLAIQNAAALLFPSWVRLGTHRASGIETLGQGILTTAGSLLVLLLALIPPAIVAGGIVMWTGDQPPALALAAVAGSGVLLWEVWWGVGRLGRVWERGERVQETA